MTRLPLFLLTTLLLLTIRLSAQPLFRFAPPVRESHGLIDADLDTLSNDTLPIAVYPPHFLDVDTDGDYDAFITIQGFDQDGAPFAQVYFQENRSDDQVILFGNPVAIQSLFGYTPAFGDIDQDGDFDMYWFAIWDCSPSEYRLICVENLSSSPHEFEMGEQHIQRVAMNVECNFDYEQNRPGFLDADGDGDQDLVIVIGRNVFDDPAAITYQTLPLYFENPGTDSLLNFPISPEMNPSFLSGISNDPDPEINELIKFSSGFMDMDQDGDADFLGWTVVVDTSGFDPLPEFRTYYKENKGDSTAVFDSTRHYIQLLGTGGNRIATYADLDQDGDMDGIAAISDSIGNMYIYWYENLGDEAQVLKGRIYRDLNDNEQPDPGEGLAHREVLINEDYLLVHTDTAGLFSAYLPEGDYTIRTPHPVGWTSIPEDVSATLTDSDTAQADFRWESEISGFNLSLSAASTALTRPGFQTRHRFEIENLGFENSDAELIVHLDNALTFLSSDPPPDTQDGQDLRWNFTDIAPFAAPQVVRMQSSVATGTLGDTLCSDILLSPITGDIDNTDNSLKLCQVVTGSYDPNDKLVHPLGIDASGNVDPSTDLFTYTVRFQNTGTDTAFRVVVTDMIDPDFDLATFRMKSASHEYELMIENHIATWTFHDILLPDSNVNESESHGYLQYQIAPLTGRPVGTEFTNEADIYFDYNLPVRTNTTVNTFAIPLGIRTFGQLNFQLFPNPSSDRALLTFPNPEGKKAELELFDAQGKRVLRKETSNDRFTIDRNALPPGVYSFRIGMEGLWGNGKVVCE